ncbi:zinc-ribbon and DUF3426 domain-containing protein [Paraburkholderia flava]|uniref:zinc-ribbon and DUF3426 domain-containing protein n=1 Tax=Paraburkholderia flava TaxID=2547393 RepID=UPI00105D8D1B|nr:zinc-ribbon and DUF3426 domain-containing protein [Paraburkholderia flava]
MLLATRCPFCETVFRLQPAQLQLRRGLVRCGHCQEVFDGSTSLYETTEGGDFSTATPVSADLAAALTSGAAEAATPSAEPPSLEHSAAPDFRGDAWNPWAPAADAAAAQSEPPAPHTPSTQPPFAAPVPPAAASSESHAAAEPQSIAPDERDAPTWRSTTEPALADTLSSPLPPPPLDKEPHLEPHFSSHAGEPFADVPPTDGTDHFAVVRETRAPAPRRTGWRIFGILVALALLVLLLAQLAWWQRETVMVYWPQSRPLYEQACARIGCTVAPPRDIDGLQVEPSDLRQVDGPHRLELKMPLRNRFNVALAYPAIELTLLDAQNNVAVRRVLWPQDYVKPGTPVAAGLPARTTQTMIVRLDTGNAVASNFRVQIFYP